jgi:hypothetical protein
MKNRFLLAFMILLLIQNCTEDINLNVIGGGNQIVIEGTIENGKPAEVIVTRSSPVSKAVDLNKIIVSDAKVYVSDGSITDTLQITLDTTVSIPVVYKGSKIIGVPGHAYYLTVIADGQTLSSSTTIPQLIALDSVWWKADPPHDSLGYAWAHLTDPSGLGNAYKWFAKRPKKDRRYISPDGSTMDDKFIDGKSIDFYNLRGIDATSTAQEDKDSNRNRYYYKMKDTIYIKFCTIDYATLRFYQTYETSLQSSGNPFASPTSIQSNIKGGLGIWAGYGATFDTIMPKP